MEENSECERTFPGFQDEWNALPSWVVDPECCGGVSGTNGATGDSFVVEVAGFAVG